MSTLLEPHAPVAPPTLERLASLDVLRGLIILVMIFVNDVAGVRGAPGWMKHIEPPNADGMTFVDVVFPAFLFIVGLAIPLALERRLERGQPVVGHVAARALGLLVLGVFMVNAGSASAEGALPPAVWILCVYATALLIWLDLPRVRTRRILGGVLLAGFALLYRGPGADRLIELRTQWWGILGLIGWAYLVASLLYLSLRGRPLLLAAGVVALYAVFAGDALGMIPSPPWLAVGSVLGSHAALTLSGACAGAAMLLPDSPWRTPRARLRFALACGAIMAGAALGLHVFRDVHAMFIINKIAATPAWCLWSGAITLWLWAAIYWLLDVRRMRVPKLLADSGQNALLAYLLAPIAYAVMTRASLLLGMENPYGLLGTSFWPGLVRALLFAVAICGAAAALRRRGLTLRL